MIRIAYIYIKLTLSYMKILNLIHVFGNKWIKLHHIINIEQIRTIFGIILKPLSLQQAMTINRSPWLETGRLPGKIAFS